MKHQISTSIIINAVPASVWKVLTDFEAYPQWNPFIKSIKGTIRLGQRFDAEIGTMKFKPTTQAFEENKEFTWLGHFLFSGIFDGRHSFEIADNGDGTTTLIQKEEFNGLLVRFMKKKLDTEIVSGFNTMNEKLKERVEKGNH
ncbi:MAG: SRPBCC domain-containing protein [Crocinitomicaceae bacterium]|nr:SRPBCC domain-containing protein [Crocinitomicaceae bacterium]